MAGSELFDIYASAISSAVVGFMLGRFSRKTEPITLAEIQRYMHRVVNAEQADEKYNLTRKMLHDAKRRTMPRFDAGDPAKVYRMRTRRPAPRRVSIDPRDLGNS